MEDLLMSTINTAIATTSLLAKSENSTSPSSVTIELADFFDEIDSKTEARRDDTVNFSSEGQFKLNIQSHAFSLLGEERTQFIDALDQSGEEIFDEEFISWLRCPQTELNSMINRDYQPINPFTDVHPDTEFTVLYSGPTLIGNWNFTEVSRSSDIHETDHLTNRLDRLSSKASKVLSDQDLATVTGTMKRAVQASQNNLDSSYSIFRTNYDYEVADQAISKLSMSDSLEKQYRNFLSDIKSFQHQRIVDSIDQQEKQIQNLPQYSGILTEEREALEEGLRINEKLQNSIADSKDGLFGVENYFQILIRDSEPIKGESSENISDMFNHFTDQVNEFNRIFIEKDRGESLYPNIHSDPVIDTAFEETQELTKQYISAINAYMSYRSYT